MDERREQPLALSRHQQDLSDVLAAFKKRVGARRLRKWEGGMGHGAKLTSSEQRPRLGLQCAAQFSLLLNGTRAQARTGDGKAIEDNLLQVDLCYRPSAPHQAPRPFDSLSSRSTQKADEIENDVDTRPPVNASAAPWKSSVR